MATPPRRGRRCDRPAAGRPSARCRRRPARAAVPVGAAPAASPPCRPSSDPPGRPAHRAARARRRRSRPCRGSRRGRSTASARGWAGRSGSPGGRPPGPWRSTSSSGPGRTGRGRRRRADRPRRGCAWPAVRPGTPRSPGYSIRRNVGPALYRARRRGGGPRMPGRRRRSTSRGSTSTRKRTTTAAPKRRAPKKPGKRGKPVPDLPTAGPGERVWILAVPFRAPAPGATWLPTLQAHVWVGAELPGELAPYDPAPYTFERFLEDELNEKPRPLPLTAPLVPRPQQEEGAAVVAAHAAASGRVFLLGDDPGVGKTGTAILAVHAIAEQRPVRTVLVIADRPAAITIPHWSRSIAGFGDGGIRWCVTTWDRLAKVRALRFDVVVADEAHMVRHTTTQRWKHWKAVSGAGRVKD